MYAYDIETRSINGLLHPLCVCFGDVDEVKAFYSEKCVGDSIDYIVSLGKSMNIYVHNLDFDGYIILAHLSKFYDRASILIIDKRLYMVRIRITDKIVVEWRCSYKLVSVSLSRAGEDFLSRRKMSFPYTKLENLCDDEISIEMGDLALRDHKFLPCTFRAYLIRYCENDVRMTIELVELYFESLKKIGLIEREIRNTYSHSSMMIKFFFRKMNKMLISDKLKGSVDSFVRKSYYGGRCEVYGNPNKGEKIYHFDYPGMYGLVMLDDFPLGDGEFGEHSYTRLGFHEIEWFLDPNLNVVPVLPTKCFKSGRLMFQCGHGQGCYWSEEIELHIKMGGIVKKTIMSYVFDKKGRVFKNYVDMMFEVRRLGGINKYIGKSAINSLYGRLGMSGHSEKGYLLKMSDSEVGYKIVESANVKIGYKLTYEAGSYKNIIYSSIITSKARIKLYTGQKSLKDAGFRVLYSDTDSIFFASKRKVKDGSIGEIVIRNDSENLFNDAVFALPKTYGLRNSKKEIVKVKGLNSRDIDFDTLKKYFYDQGIITSNKNSAFKKSNLTLFIERDLDKKIDLGSYKKRKWINNFKDTESIENTDTIYND